MTDKKEKGYKEPVPQDFIPTELGSAIQANVSGRPGDKEIFIDGEGSEKITGNPGAEQTE